MSPVTGTIVMILFGVIFIMSGILFSEYGKVNMRIYTELTIGVVT